MIHTFLKKLAYQAIELVPHLSSEILCHSSFILGNSMGGCCDGSPATRLNSCVLPKPQSGDWSGTAVERSSARLNQAEHAKMVLSVWRIVSLNTVMSCWSWGWMSCVDRWGKNPNIESAQRHLSFPDMQKVKPYIIMASTWRHERSFLRKLVLHDGFFDDKQVASMWKWRGRNISVRE